MNEVEGKAGRWSVVAAAMIVVAQPRLVGADASAKNAQAAASATARARSARHVISGFRMEGDPTLEMVFGDADRFKGHVDRFYELHQAMRDVQADFGRMVRITQTTLSAHQRRCPNDALAPLYTQAYRLGQRFRELGAEFEEHFAAMQALDKLGETAALTPDYRWRVNRARPLYRAALVDYREMRAQFDVQLASDLKFRQCDPLALLEAGSASEASAEPPPTSSAAPPKDASPAAKTSDLPLAAPATFFVDNRKCNDVLHVYVDGALVGQVASRAKAAFQTDIGTHSLCIIQSGARHICGDPGTIRSAYVHDGWSLALHCP
jgi:hypothetical protein